MREPLDPFCRGDALGGDLVCEIVDLLELVHVELAALDPHHPGAQLGGLPEAHDDGGRGREDLGLEVESCAADSEGFLQTVCGRAVAMQSPPEGQHEGDRIVVRSLAHTPHDNGAGMCGPENTERPSGNSSVRFSRNYVKLTKSNSILGA